MPPTLGPLYMISDSTMSRNFCSSLFAEAVLEAFPTEALEVEALLSAPDIGAVDEGTASPLLLVAPEPPIALRNHTSPPFCPAVLTAAGGFPMRSTVRRGRKGTEASKGKDAPWPPAPPTPPLLPRVGFGDDMLVVDEEAPPDSM